MSTTFDVTGRIVQGHPMRATQKKDADGRPVLNDDGTPRMIRQFTLAIPEADFMAANGAWPAMYAEAVSAVPNALQMPKFAWKFKRASDLDPKGVPYANREGYAGCIALNISSELPVPPPLYRQQPNGQYVQMGPDEIKTGDYCFVRISCRVQVPKLATHTPSLYINPSIIIFVGYGSEIMGAAIDPNEVFKGRTFALPAGATAMPTAPSMAASAPVPQQPAYQAPTQHGMAAPAQHGMAAPVPVQPAHGFVANAGNPANAYPGIPGGGMSPAAGQQPIPGMGGIPTMPGHR